MESEEEEMDILEGLGCSDCEYCGYNIAVCECFNDDSDVFDIEEDISVEDHNHSEYSDDLFDI